MPSMTDTEISDFLSVTRYGVLSYLTDSNCPVSVPVWFDWDGTKVDMFTHVSTPKMRNLRRDPRVSLLVTNFPSEQETWVRFEGSVRFVPDGLEVAERVLDRYYPEGDARRPVIEEWRRSPDDWPKMELLPRRVVSHRE
jgi:PPOX class probable F420-dependent enzyme